ncbi:MAG: 50S ribosomal protein L6 [Candidatus Yanofskybacteria bacterium RIFCSPHIGHO2_02_FULL_41_11]|uniref:Large ribosomal subunit protein uL6 n=1 Tax=Candidatus Yanofskybacteria bacterium RIFCSPHIGHO2_02_FULL_41_11 TaxID=1802675 RepID=A0A1F8FA78_9BACT|nr:MAG: 50S ribosomal protein L6 [Candidatus Yanofskybacteria bacterium RIFCSPHIGHO2_02_FULL_41_11]
MSKIGKKLIAVPSGVEVNINSNFISVKGPKGELKRDVSDFLALSLSDNQISVKPKDEKSLRDKNVRALWGLSRALISNMVKGVSDGFEKTLEFQGVGYKAAVKEGELELGLGFSHPVKIQAPEGIEFKVEKNTIKISGIDKDLVGRVAANIRSKRKPEPYKGSGIRYQGEIIKKKAGKKAVAAG